MHTTIILPIEPLESRYTSEWLHAVPKQLVAYAESGGLKVRTFADGTAYMAAGRDDSALTIVSMPGHGRAQSPTAGAFINFASTNRWKCEQISAFVTLIEAGLVRSGDKVLVTDAWNPGIFQLAYLRDLCGIQFEISAIWHAGSYDPWDFLGRNIPDKRWSYAAERALFWAIDRNYFTTRFHMELFAHELGLAPDDVGSSSVLCGYPNEYLWDSLPPHRVPASERPDLILFPHRLAPEKQADIFRDLAVTLPQYEWVVCQDAPLTKAEYHALLGRAKLSFSAALQETLGIAQAEATIAGAMPLCPRRLAYPEQYCAPFLYPSEWTASWDAYLRHKDSLVAYVRMMMDDYASPKMQAAITAQEQVLKDCFLTALPLYRNLVGA